MRTVDLFKKSYRQVRGSIQNQVIDQVNQIFIGYNQEVIHDALYDSNPQFYYSNCMSVIRFVPKSFSRLCQCIDQYQKAENESKEKSKEN